VKYIYYTLCTYTRSRVSILRFFFNFIITTVLINNIFLVTSTLRHRQCEYLNPQNHTRDANPFHNNVFAGVEVMTYMREYKRMRKNLHIVVYILHSY